MKSMTKSVREFCAEGLFERPRYFPRQLITPAEMTLEQNYFRDKMRRHNRLLHGWGVVCGARVCPVPNPDKSDAEPWKVAVHPGYILGPYGDEIVIERERTIDLRAEGSISVCGDSAGAATDPWCSDVFIRRPDDGGDITLYVAVKYKEGLARPIRVQPTSCGCSDTQCEFSRLCDGYEIGVLNNCPESHKNPPLVDLDAIVAGSLLDCPECPADPWVVLARVKLTSDGVIQEVDNCSCRRIVISFGRFWGQCATDMIKIDTVTPDVLAPGVADQTLTITGTNLFSNSPSMVSLGEGVSVKTVTQPQDQSGKQLTITVSVDADAAVGSRDLRLINPDCSTAVKQITVSGQTPGGGILLQPVNRTTPGPTTETPSKKAPSKKRRGEK
jgi:hypothetical protein